MDSCNTGFKWQHEEIIQASLPKYTYKIHVHAAEQYSQAVRRISVSEIIRK